MAQTLSEKIWDRHLVHRGDGDPDLLYVDLHLIHEVTSPQAFDGLRLAGRTDRRPDLTVATMDHNVPTTDIHLPVRDPISAKQMQVLAQNCEEFGIRLYAMGQPGQGIVHVIGPEQGLTQPGMTIVCGDSHTSTHGAFGALAVGIGTSEVEHVLATQTLPQSRPKWMSITVDGELPEGVADQARPGRVELGRRLVEDHVAWAHREQAGDRDQLGLAAREPRRVAELDRLDAEQRHRRPRPLDDLGHLEAQVLRAQGDFLEDGRGDPRALRVGVLESDDDPARELVGLAPRHRLAVDRQRPCQRSLDRRRREARGHEAERRLARLVRPTSPTISPSASVRSTSWRTDFAYPA